MATPVAFPEANLVLGPPVGVSEDEVVRLPALWTPGLLTSCWAHTDAEIAEIVRTGVSWLRVWGDRTHPPVYVSGHRAEVV